MAGSAEHATVKAKRLAQLVGGRCALLILDGVEPLQYPPSSVAFPPGQLEDQGIAKLLKDLALTSRGLCIVTTRYAIPDLDVFKGQAMLEEKLTRLSRENGVRLLKSIGVKGSERRNIPLNDGDPNGAKVNEFELLVEDVKGHALTLQIMGGFLSRAFGGDIRQRDRVKFEKADEKIDGGHAFRAMAAYAKWMEDGSPEAPRELTILRCLGLFDRPATRDCLEALLQPPTIASLTEPLVGVAQDDWLFSLDALDRANLLALNRDISGELLSLDTHPHIREYFSTQLRENNPDAWRAAHRRLYEYLRDNTHEGEEPRLENLQPLYQAVAHGCQAGLQQEAWDEVQYPRILRKGSGYSIKKLAAHGAELAALACYFEKRFNKVSVSVSRSGQAIILNGAAYCLRVSGRLLESLGPIRASLQITVEDQHWKNAALRASNLSELELTLGDIAEAVRDAKASVTYADLSKDAFWKTASRSTCADALHQAGRPAEIEAAQALFREAEQMQKERQPDYPLLYSTSGFKYCDLLLAAPERAAWQVFGQKVETVGDISELLEVCSAVGQRAAKTLDWWLNHFTNASLFDTAMEHLTQGRASLYETILTNSKLGTPYSELALAVDKLRRAGHQDELPKALLSRAWLRSLTWAHTDTESAREDLDEAWEIAERGPMRLHMADIHLYRARLFHAVKPYPWNKFADGSEGRGPKDDLTDARKLIEQCGYWRRKEELEDAEEAAKGWA